MMKDNHVAGEGNAYYTLFREYDPDLGRWWRPDPIFQPWQSPYSAFNGNPIMLTDVWGLEGEDKTTPPKGSTEGTAFQGPTATVTAEALEGTGKIEYANGYSKPLLWVKHDGNWIISNVYNAKMKNLVDNLNNPNYNPSSDGFNLDAPLSDAFLSEFASRASKQWGREPFLINKIFEKVGYHNPFFAGHGLEDNSQEMAALLGLAGGLFKKAIGWLAEKGAAKLSIEVVEVLAKDLVKGDATEATKIGFNSGTAGESYLASLVSGSAHEFFRTSLGNRFIDQFANGIAHESKVGYTVLSKRIKIQILKDVELIQRGQINASTWHFFRSGITGRIGPSKPLQDFLTKNGINFIIYK